MGGFCLVFLWMVGELGMGYNFTRVDRDQAMLLPVSMRDWLAEDHLVWFVLEAVERVDMTRFHASYRQDGRGGMAHDPQMMVALLLYAYTQNVFSSRQIEQRCVHDVAFRVICGMDLPDHTTISRFRARHEDALEEVFTASLVLCAHVGLAQVGTVALDGTKIKAQACGHATMDEQGLVKKAELYHLDTGREQKMEDAICVQVESLLEQTKNAEAASSQEEATPGLVRGRADRQARFDQAQQVIAQKKQRDLDTYEAKKRVQDERNKQAGRKLGGRVKHPAERKNPPVYKANFSDPDSAPMKTVQGFIQGYNAQAWASQDQVILGVNVYQQSQDAYLLSPMMDCLDHYLGKAGLTGRPEVVLADAGYCQESELAWMVQNHPEIDAYIAANTGGEPSLGKRGPIPQSASLVQRMRRKVGTKNGLAIYRKRRWMIEPVFARLKHNANFTRFSRRGITAVTSEFHLIAAAHNMKTAFTHLTRTATPAIT